MAELVLVEVFDGDQGPVIVTELRDNNGAVMDSTPVAMQLRITDSSGVAITTLPGIPQTPRSSGLIWFYLKGSSTDLLGLGGTLLAHPKIHIALAPDQTVATNLLVNGSFDTDANVDGIADSWTRSGSGPAATWAVGADDPAPPVISGSRQSIVHAAGGDTDYLTQTANVTLVAGDYLSAWVWHRATRLTGFSGPGANYFMGLLPAGGSEFQAAFTDGEQDWNLVRASGRVTLGAATATLRLVTYSTVLYRACFDDAFMWKGLTGITTPDHFEIRVKPRPRKAKTETHEMTDGVGSFEVDSNSDGLADGWATFASGVTFTLDGANANVGFGSEFAQKVTTSGAAGKSIRLTVRDKFTAGESWQVTVYYKTNGALTGSPAAGAFGVTLSTENFNGANESNVGTNFNLNQASYTTGTATLVLTQDHDVLVIDINISSVTGTFYLDDVQLQKL